jgi:hypothetical protein
MTPEEVKMIDALRGCNFLPGSYDKRFVRSIWEMLAKENPEKPKPLTENQHIYLVALFHKYRNQHLAHEASECPVCLDIKRKVLEAEKEKLDAWKRGEAKR